MSKQESPIFIDRAKCSPCSELICVGVCPQGILEVGKDKKPQIIDVLSCTRCGVCANLCQSKAITLTNNKQSTDR